MASPENLKKIFLNVKLAEKKLIVVSALKGITDLLIKLAEILRAHKFELAQSLGLEIIQIHKDSWSKFVSEKIFDELEEDLAKHIKASVLLKEQSEQAKNKLISRGEVYSSILLNELLISLNLRSDLINASKILYKEKNHFRAKLDIIKDKLSSKNIIITQGFAYTENRKLKIMERGGSDFSASIFGRDLNAKCVIIWTDVSGVYSSDPNKFDNAKILKEISYLQLVELSKFGAKVMQVDSIKPAIQNSIKVYLKNTFDMHSLGTEIVDTPLSESKSIAYSNSYLKVKYSEDELAEKVRLILAISKHNKSNLEFISSNNDLNIFTKDTEFNRNLIGEDCEKYSILLITGRINKNSLNLDNIKFIISDEENYVSKFFIKDKLTKKQIEKIHEHLIK